MNIISSSHKLNALPCFVYESDGCLGSGFALAPLADFAVGILHKIQDENSHEHARYEAKDKDGE